MNQLLSELRRRNVFRVAAAYLVVGWMLIQVVTLIEAPLALPAWTDTLVIVLLGIGFPVAGLLAWAFDITPEGMRPTSNLEEGESATPYSGRKLDYGIAVGLVLVIMMLGWQQLRPHSGTPTDSSALDAGSASVAVLPFADMSADGDQEYFADGISEEILNVLVRLPGLRVAGRTSSFAYKGRNEDLREIGEALGVSYVLEGSVRRSGPRLRITAQLIRSEDGFHIWSETYDREMTDIFDIQDEIAAAVTGELAASLGLVVERENSTRTDDILAYEYYLRARPLFLERTTESTRQALTLLTMAVARDPEFSPAWTSLAGVFQVYEFYHADASRESMALWRQAALETANRAIALNPHDAEAYAYLGEALGWDKVGAFEAFDRALELSPNDASVLDRVAQNLNHSGYFVEAELLARRAVALDPQVAIYHFTLARSVGGFLSNDANLEHLEEALRLNPGFRHGYMAVAHTMVRRGDFAGTRAIIEAMLENIPRSSLPDESYQAFVDARTVEDLRAIAEIEPTTLLTGWSLRRWAISLTGEVEPLLQALDEMWQGSDSGRHFLFLHGALPGVRNDPRWKAEVRRTGILALWRVRGFPAQCRPLEGDDFECDAWMGPQ
jgi:TolB-like protein/Tfp pilus assembly protein PilF